MTYLTSIYTLDGVKKFVEILMAWGESIGYYSLEEPVHVAPGGNVERWCEPRYFPGSISFTSLFSRRLELELVLVASFGQGSAVCRFSQVKFLRS